MAGKYNPRDIAKYIKDAAKQITAIAKRLILGNPETAAKEDVAKAEKLAADDVMKLLRRTVPLRTGALADSLRVVPNGKTCTVESDLDRFKFLVEGTKPHIIMPKQRKALAFEWQRGRGGRPNVGGVASAKSATGRRKAGAKLVFYSMVKHPGQAPRPQFVDAAIALYERKFPQYLRKVQRERSKR